MINDVTTTGVIEDIRKLNLKLNTLYREVVSPSEYYENILEFFNKRRVLTTMLMTLTIC